MNISITPSLKNGYFNNLKSKQNTTAPNFGNKAAYRFVDNIATIVPNFALTKMPELKPNQASIKRYIESLYNRESGFGVDKFEEKVSKITESIDDETLDFAHEITSLLKPENNNQGLNQNLSNLESFIKLYQKNPSQRQTIMNEALKTLQAKNNLDSPQAHLLDIPQA